MAEQMLAAWLFIGKRRVIQWVGTTTFATRTKHHLFAAKGFVQVNIIRGTHRWSNGFYFNNCTSFDHNNHLCFIAVFLSLWSLPLSNGLPLREIWLRRIILGILGFLKHILHIHFFYISLYLSEFLYISHLEINLPTETGDGEGTTTVATTNNNNNNGKHL